MHSGFFDVMFKLYPVSFLSCYILVSVSQSYIRVPLDKNVAISIFLKRALEISEDLQPFERDDLGWTRAVEHAGSGGAFT